LGQFVVDGQRCTEDINVQNQASNLTIPQSIQVIIPMSRFSCHGRVTSFVVQLSRDNGNTISYPSIQIWHPESDNMYTSIKFSIHKITAIGPMEINITGNGQVEPGDCIGYYQPSDSCLIRQTNETGYTSHIISTNNSLNDFFFVNNSIQNITLQPVITVTFGKYTHDG